MNPPEFEESPPDGGDGYVEGSEGSYSFGGPNTCSLVGLYAVLFGLRMSLGLPDPLRRLIKKKARAATRASPTTPPTTPARDQQVC